MGRLSTRLVTLVTVVAAAGAAINRPPHAQEGAVAPGRSVAVTFDDLPYVAGLPGGRCRAEAILDLNRELLGRLANPRVPATGFVVAGNVCEDIRQEVLPRVLELWLDGGHELGNHTFSHPDFNRTPVQEYARDMERGAALLRRILEDRGLRLRYFRPPYLRTGDTAEKHRAFAKLMRERGLTVAPVTLDNDEYVFAYVYARAVAAGDDAVARRVADAYAPWLETVVEHLERRSVDVLGYEPPQVLLLHVNLLNARHFDGLADMLASRGYRFVSLDRALRDPAYGRPDPYVGQRGVSWIHRWGTRKGLPVEMEPGAPDWLWELYRGYSGG